VILAVLVAAGCGPDQQAAPADQGPPPSSPAPSASGQPSATAGPAGAGGSLELAKKYAPVVRMGDGEKNLPIDAELFIRNSELKWNRDDCPDETLDEQPTGAGLADPNRYRARATEDNSLCRGRTGREYNTTERTRPFANQAELGREGFFLDLRNELREAGRVTGESAAPAYVEYVDGTGDNAGKTGYVYWFLYPYNRWTNPARGVGGNHEGDWERVTVVVGKSGKPEGVVFSQHETKCRADWAEVAGKDGHPVVYSATGTHGSYPIGDARYKIESLPKALRKVGALEDRTSTKGQSWQTWLTLKEVQRESWWGYAGGWGEVGGPVAAKDLDKHQTGPEGPNPIKHTEQMVAEAFSTGACPEPASREDDAKQAAIRRLEEYLHALGREDAGAACSIAVPELASLCLAALPQAFRETSEREKKVLRKITIDPRKVKRVSKKRYDFPPSSLRGRTSLTDGSLVMVLLGEQWYLSMEKG